MRKLTFSRSTLRPLTLGPAAARAIVGGAGAGISGILPPTEYCCYYTATCPPPGGGGGSGPIEPGPTRQQY